jgi:hypothetical protein
MDNQDAKAIAGLIIAAASIALFFYAAVLLIQLAAFIFFGWLIHYAVNKSPRALERKAREHTHALYRQSA